MNAVVTNIAPTAVRPVLVPQTFDQLVRFSEMAAVSGLMPKDYVNKPGAIMIAVQMGSELGLAPMQSLTSIAVINGRPGLWGDGLIGICRQSPLCQDIQESISGEGDARTAVCIATRRGASACTGKFSVADAKRAGLWAKGGPWTQYPDRMLQNRARGFALRDAFPDLLRGLKTVEELRDTPPDKYQGTTIDADPEPPPVVETPKPPPPPAPKRTAATWMAELRTKLDAAESEAAVDAIATSDEVQKALGWLKNGALDELNAMLAEAIALHATPHDPETGEVDDRFPGDAAP